MSPASAMFSPTAIADFLACRHLTALNRAAAAGEIQKPMFADPGLELLIKLGLQHEEAYLRELTETGLHISSIPSETDAGLDISTIPNETGAGLNNSTIPTGNSADSAARTKATLTSSAKGKVASSTNSENTSPPNSQPTFWELAEPTSFDSTVVSTTETKGTSWAEAAVRTSWAEAAGRTIEAMRDGADVIYQAAFLSGQWYGRADFLLRVEKPSALGDWSYEVVETKLARSTKERAIIQLCFYSDLVAEIQGVLPDYMHVVLGGGAQPEKFSVQRYLAYFRKIRKDFQEGYAAQAATYPEPVDHCGICAWITVCRQRWREDDHLSLVAGITRNQRKVLVENRITTVRQLGALTFPPEPKIESVGDRALLTIREQARLQVQGRTEGRHVYDLLVPPEAEKGLCSVPPPSPGDVFLDFEGDPYATEQGLEYLFGVVTLDEGTQPIYSADWALNQKEEKRAFEAFIAMVMERRRRYPDMHIYHYGAYEETALKHMAGRHGVGVDEVDELLRGDVLVDLYRVVRQGLRASVESYSIKKLEPLYQFKREVHLVDANVALTTFQAVLALGSGDEDISAIRNAIEGYNRDDCISTLRLRDWLEERRRELEVSTGVAPLPRPQPKESEPTKDLSDYLLRVRAVWERLTASLPEDENEWPSLGPRASRPPSVPSTLGTCSPFAVPLVSGGRDARGPSEEQHGPSEEQHGPSEEQRACWLMAQLLEWHRREEKPCPSQFLPIDWPTLTSSSG